jgi:hypothetical protein
MASGSLGSLVPLNPGTNYSLYTSPSSTLVEGKVYITNRDSFPVKVRVAISTDTIQYLNSSDYVVYDKKLNAGESYETESIYFSDGQTVIVKSDNTNVNFNLLGTEVGITTNCGVLTATSITQTKLNESLYISPSDIDLNIFACNKNPDPATIRIGIGTEISSKNYIEYNYTLHPGDVYSKTNLKVGTNDVIFIKSSNTNVNFVVCGNDS